MEEALAALGFVEVIAKAPSTGETLASWAERWALTRPGVTATSLRQVTFAVLKIELVDPVIRSCDDAVVREKHCECRPGHVDPSLGKEVCGVARTSGRPTPRSSRVEAAAMLSVTQGSCRSKCV